MSSTAVDSDLQLLHFVHRHCSTEQQQGACVKGGSGGHIHIVINIITITK